MLESSVGRSDERYLYKIAMCMMCNVPSAPGDEPRHPLVPRTQTLSCPPARCKPPPPSSDEASITRLLLQTPGAPSPPSEPKPAGTTDAAARTDTYLWEPRTCLRKPTFDKPDGGSGGRSSILEVNEVALRSARVWIL